MKSPGTEFSILEKEVGEKNSSQNCFVKDLEVKVITNMKQIDINIFHRVFSEFVDALEVLWTPQKQTHTHNNPVCICKGLLLD